MRTNIKTTTIKEKPIYILGTNAISLYLAAKFQLGGERVILLTDKRDEGNLSGTDFNIKEDSLNKIENELSKISKIKLKKEITLAS